MRSEAQFLSLFLAKIVQLSKLTQLTRHLHVAGRLLNMTQSISRQEEIADKRVALTPSTWADLSRLKEPGKTLGDTVADLIAEHQLRTLERDLDEIDKDAHFVPWDKAKKELGL